jgi:ribosomal protein L29
MDKEMLNELRAMFKEELKAELEPIKADIKEMKADIKAFKDQFTDYEGKSANNHVQVINRIDNMQKDLNTMELVTSKNWNDIAQLKAVK